MHTASTTDTITTSEVVVAVDANGSDLGPAEVAAGAALAAAQGARVLLFGPAAQLAAEGLPDGVELIDAPVSIAKSADPARAARATPEASIVQAARAVAEGRAHALVCAGGTGAALAAGLFNIKRASGIHRPALALPLPVPRRVGRTGGRHTVTLLDVGANTQARPEHLVQFAFMGAALAQAVLGVTRPRVALLANGEEDSRGGPLVTEAAAQLRERLAAADSAGGVREDFVVYDPAARAREREGFTAAGVGGGVGEGLAGEDPAVRVREDRLSASQGLTIEFVGNVEGGDVTDGVADVVVTDGLTGNIALKLIEGVSQTMIESIRAAAESSGRAKLGGLLLRPALRAFRDEIDPEAQGGAYLLGLRRLGVVPHGRFTRRGFAQAILRAERGAREDVVGVTHHALDAAGALRRAPGAASPSAEDASLRGNDS
ncbi:MAG TPA: phosphate acyltransferase PlsX [Solirubrobacteraceae bacterium]